MKYPFCIVSDLHAHSWSAFSNVDKDGVNSRLRIILDELERAADVLQTHGGTVMFDAGDTFHQRGELKPSVFNPTVECFRRVASKVEVHGLPGNHDLEGKDADTLGNAIQTLATIPNFNVYVKPTLVGDVWVFPWFSDLKVLRAELQKRADPTKDAIIHAPVNGVIKGIPNHGLEASELAAMGYRRVFAGHFHNHVVFEGGKVISIGALAHQTWSDPGTKAGFLLVYEDRIEHVPTQAPLFVDIDFASDHSSFDDVDLELECKGNYVRVRLNDLTEKEKLGWKKEVMDVGALGCLVLGNTKSAVTARSGAGAHAAVSLAASVEHFIRADLKPFLIEEVSLEAQDVLNEAMT